MPAVPLLDTHRIRVQLLVQIIEQGDGVDDHGIDLVGRELEPVARQGVRQTQRHLLEVLGQHAGDEVRQMLTDRAEQVGGRRVGDGLDVQVGELDNRAAELALGHGQSDLLLVLELIEEAGQLRGDLAVNHAGDFLERARSAIELGKLLVLDSAEKLALVYEHPWGGGLAFSTRLDGPWTYSLTILSTVDRRSARLSASSSFLSAALKRP